MPALMASTSVGVVGDDLVDEGFEFAGFGGFEAEAVGDGGGVLVRVSIEDGEDFVGLVGGEGAVLDQQRAGRGVFRGDRAVGDAECRAR